MNNYYTKKVGDIIPGVNFHLMNMLSSKMSAAEYSYACSSILSAANRYGFRPSWMSLSGTPLNETIIAAMDIIPMFKKEYKLQIVNTVFLTDGDGHTLQQIWQQTEDGRFYGDYSDNGQSAYRRQKKLVIVDPVTQHQEFVDDMTCKKLTSHFLKFLKIRTGANVVGFFILSSRMFGKEIRELFGNTADDFALKAKFRKDKSMIVTSAGYDEFYLLRAEGLDTDDDVEFVVKENATTRGLVSAFSKYTGNRLANRVVLNRFVEMIA